MERTRTAAGARTSRAQRLRMKRRTFITPVRIRDPVVELALRDEPGAGSGGCPSRREWAFSAARRSAEPLPIFDQSTDHLRADAAGGQLRQSDDALNGKRPDFGRHWFAQPQRRRSGSTARIRSISTLRTTALYVQQRRSGLDHSFQYACQRNLDAESHLDCCPGTVDAQAAHRECLPKVRPSECADQRRKLPCPPYGPAIYAPITSVPNWKDFNSRLGVAHDLWVICKTAIKWRSADTSRRRVNGIASGQPALAATYWR